MISNRKSICTTQLQVIFINTYASLGLLEAQKNHGKRGGGGGAAEQEVGDNWLKDNIQ